MPAVHAEQSSLLCIDTITPVVIRRTGNKEIGKTIYRDDPTAENIVSTLRCSRHISAATGLDYRKAEGKPLNLEILGGKIHSELVPVGGGKRWGGDGRLRGFAGRLIVRVDPRTRWLLEVAQLVGLGGRISLGFGRILVREVKS
jgi:CRISPR/Cas system endoribonuclease Cas6 (RAMP superfamily)